MYVYVFLYILSIISEHIWLDCDRVDDEDVFDGLEYGFCFGFGGEVVGEAAVAVFVFVGGYGLDLDGSVICDHIDDDDNCVIIVWRCVVCVIFIF